jgi:hypothetical protein
MMTMAQTGLLILVHLMGSLSRGSARRDTRAVASTQANIPRMSRSWKKLTPRSTAEFALRIEYPYRAIMV